ncbi:tRNA (cytosine(32)/uridine(32)-2'-O)-methyltransferase TrmJ, partial [Pseudomonas aeruginosa]
LDRIRLVLDDTSHPGNISAAAPAPKNMGTSQLVLGQPERFPHRDAAARDSCPTPILDGARVVETLEDGLSGCSVRHGTSARE